MAMGSRSSAAAGVVAVSRHIGLKTKVCLAGEQSPEPTEATLANLARTTSVGRHVGQDSECSYLYIQGGFALAC